MWYLNYCAPFIFQTGGPTETYRIIMYSALVALIVTYLIFMLLYKYVGNNELQRPQFQKQLRETLKTLTRIKFCNNDFWISSKQFKEWYLHYFGLHSVAVGLCIMYCPYLAQVIFIIIHLVLFLAATILKHYTKSRNQKTVIRIIYNILIVLCQLLNVAILFSGVMGVGASGFDQNAKICLLQSGFENSQL